MAAAAGDGGVPHRPQAASLPGGGALAAFAVRRAGPSPSERRGARPDRVPESPPPSPRERAAPRRRRRPGGGGARSPQTARGRGHRVAPRRERPAEAAWPRGRVGGGNVAPTRPPPPPPARGLGAPVGAQHLAALDPAAGAHRAPLRLGTVGGHLCCPGITESVDRTASPEDRLYQSPASAWALPLSQPCFWLRCLCWSEGAAHHGGSHIPGRPHRHRLQRPGRLLATAPLGHSLLGLPLPLCRHRLAL